MDHQETDAAGRHEKTALTSSFQLFAYADDIALIARRLPDLKEFFIQLERAVKEVGLEVNEGKTNHLVVSRSKCTAHAGQNFTFGKYNFERVRSYNHLRKLVTETNNATPAVRERMVAFSAIRINFVLILALYFQSYLRSVFVTSLTWSSHLSGSSSSGAFI